MKNMQIVLSTMRVQYNTATRTVFENKLVQTLFAKAAKPSFKHFCLNTSKPQCCTEYILYSKLQYIVQGTVEFSTTITRIKRSILILFPSESKIYIQYSLVFSIQTLQGGRKSS